MPQQTGMTVRTGTPTRPGQRQRADNSKKKNRTFSKALLIQESILIWILTFSFIILAFLCVATGYTGGLPWLSVTLTGAWSAYGISQAMYYNKSKAENTKGGIVYDTVVNSNLDAD
jgi:hypothetical protein